MCSLLIEQRRGFAVEGRHDIDAVACDANGRVIAQVGVDDVTTFRSAAKPFQLETCLALLGAELSSRLDTVDLALGAASHHGEPLHTTRVGELLNKLSRRPTHLLCGAHPPSHGPSAEALWASGGTPSVLHNNCSGKHAFMAAACVTQGWSEDYLDIGHPLQQQVLDRVHKRSGNRVAGTVIDGCGLPCFVLPLSAMAQAWAQLAVAMGSAGSSGTEADASLGRIGRAMREHPRMMSGSTAFDGWLVGSAPVLAKVGAQGLLCVALPEQGLGLALKVRSGAEAVRPVAAMSVLKRWFAGVAPDAALERDATIKNAVGTVVGEIRAHWVDG